MSRKIFGRRRTNIERQEPFVKEKNTYLIVCEGENTEPSYFKKFKKFIKLPIDIEVIGKGENTKSLVDSAIKLKEEKNYYSVWCVFDKDNFSYDGFNNAINKAKSNKINVAYSNQAFEYWLLLHFEDHQGGKMNREDYYKKINKYLSEINKKFKFDKYKKIIDENIFENLIANNRTKIAIKRAEKIDKNFRDESYAKRESSTTVYKLVKEILDYN